MKKWLKSKIEKYLLWKLGFGFCIDCGKITRTKKRFSDGADQDDDGSWYQTGYDDFCHEICYEAIIDADR